MFLLHVSIPLSNLTLGTVTDGTHGRKVAGTIEKLGVLTRPEKTSLRIKKLLPASL